MRWREMGRARFRRVELRSDQPLRPRATPCYRLAASPEELREFYRVGSLETTPSAVDWSREFVIIAERGECPTGGYAVSITGFDSRAGGELWVGVALSDPGPTDFVTLAMTFPRDVVVAGRGELERVSRVVFVGEDGRVLESVEVVL